MAFRIPLVLFTAIYARERDGSDVTSDEIANAVNRHVQHTWCYTDLGPRILMDLARVEQNQSVRVFTMADGSRYALVMNRVASQVRGGLAHLAHSSMDEYAVALPPEELMRPNLGSLQQDEPRNPVEVILSRGEDGQFVGQLRIRDFGGPNVSDAQDLPWFLQGSMAGSYVAA